MPEPPASSDAPRRLADLHAWTPDAGLSSSLAAGRGPALYVRALDAPEARVLEGRRMPGQSPSRRMESGRLLCRRIDPARSLAAGRGRPRQPRARVALRNGMVRRRATLLLNARKTISSVRPSRARRPRRSSSRRTSHSLPHPLPGGRALLYTVRHRDRRGATRSVATTSSRRPKVLVRTPRTPDTWPGVPRLPPKGHPLRVGSTSHGRSPRVCRSDLDHVVQATTAMTGAGQFSVSSNGTLAFIPGPVVNYPMRTSSGSIPGWDSGLELRVAATCLSALSRTVVSWCSGPDADEQTLWCTTSGAASRAGCREKESCVASVDTDGQRCRSSG